MIIRNKPSRDFTIVRNAALESRDLSLKAKGLWAFLMTKPDGWNVTIHGLAAQLCDGERAIRSALKELEAAGLYKKVRTITAGTQGVQWQDYIYDQPQSDLQIAQLQNVQVRNAHVRNARLRNETLVNTELEKTERVKTELAKTDPRSSLFAQKLAEKMLENNPNARTAPDKWALDIEKLHRLDKYPYEVIDAVIDWCQADEFWRGNILSGSKLRQKFGTLVLQAQRNTNKIEFIS